MKRIVFLGVGMLTALGLSISHGQDKVKNDPKQMQQDKAKKAKKQTPIGAKIKDLRFKDIRYLPRSIKEIGQRKAYVIVASTVSCPINARYWPKLKALHKAYKGQGVEFLALNVEARDSIKDMATQAVEYGVPFHFVKDMTGRSIRKLGLTTTSQVVILDGQRILKYRGRIDDQYRFNGARPKATTNELQVALNEVLAGKDVQVKETPVDGCKIQFQKEKYTGSEKITYTRHIAPMMQKHCQDCHRPGGLAPFDLMTYDDVATNAPMISEVVAERRMPPWYASEKSKGFHNYRGMNSDERARLVHWAKNGTPRGDAKDEPKARTFPKTKWEIGVPDMTIRVPQVVKLPADGYVNYKYFFIPGQFPHDRWIEAIQIRPDNTRVLHHCNMLYTIIDKNGKRQDTNFITGVVPGSGATFTQKGTAFKIPKGATIILQAHYTTTGKEETDQLTLGFKFARNVIKKELRSVRASNRSFKIPAGSSHHRVRGGAKLPGKVQAIALFT
ncbi:MAG: redoxin domain-containing protein, partial [Planctomycetota bacterium]|nr:redoxin domain-containing protein [Planctomycetota bacterium]